jgi:hypothetical protein
MSPAERRGSRSSQKTAICRISSVDAQHDELASLVRRKAQNLSIWRASGHDGFDTIVHMPRLWYCVRELYAPLVLERYHIRELPATSKVEPCARVMVVHGPRHQNLRTDAHESRPRAHTT